MLNSFHYFGIIFSVYFLNLFSQQSCWIFLFCCHFWQTNKNQRNVLSKIPSTSAIVENLIPLQNKQPPTPPFPICLRVGLLKLFLFKVIKNWLGMEELWTVSEEIIMMIIMSGFDGFRWFKQHLLLISKKFENDQKLIQHFVKF